MAPCLQPAKKAHLPGTGAYRREREASSGGQGTALKIPQTTEDGGESRARVDRDWGRARPESNSPRLRGTERGHSGNPPRPERTERRTNRAKLNPSPHFPLAFSRLPKPNLSKARRGMPRSESEFSFHLRISSPSSTNFQMRRTDRLLKRRKQPAD